MKKTLMALALLSLVVTSAHAKNFVFCSEGSPSSFNPQLVTDGTSITASSAPLYNRLVEFKTGSTEIIPALAESYTVSKDGKTYTFNLRPNVKFHTTKYFTPTRNFNADDVIFSFERQRNKSHPYHNVGGGNYEYFHAMEMDKLIKSVTKKSDMQVVVELNSPDSTFMANLAMSFMSILSSEYADKLAKANQKQNMDTMPVGTGPFIFQAYQKDSMIRYGENPQYWSKKGNISRLVFAITPDTSVRTQKVKTGECNFVTDPSPVDLANLQKNAKLKVINSSGFNVGFLAMNVTKKPFDNVLVRRAVAHALNKASYINAIYMNNAVVAKNTLPPTIWSYNNAAVPYEYSLEKAKQLMKQAGLEKGFETTLWTLPVSRPYNPNGKKMGELMQADLAKIGIKVTLVSYDWPTYLEKSKNGEHSLMQMGWTGDNGDPDNFLNVLLGCASIKAGSNYPRWCNKEFNKLLIDAKVETVQAKRAKLYEKAQLIQNTEMPLVNIAHSKTFKVMTKNISGYVQDPLGQDYFTMVNVQ